LRDLLARADLDDHRIEHGLATVRPRLGADGRYRRTSGECISTQDVADLLLASERAKHAPPATTITVNDLADLRTRLAAERAREAAETRSISAVLDRLSSPLDTITPG
jgi:hypothetical protein